MSKVIVGQVFARVNVEDSIKGRIFSSPEDREKWYERQAKRLDIRTKDKVSQAIRDLFGGLAGEVKFSFSRTAGCGMCPCSPGWNVSVEFANWSDANSKVGWTLEHPTRERFQFFVNEKGQVDVRRSVIRYKWDDYKRRSYKGYAIQELFYVL